MLNLEEEGAYIRLLCFCWQHGSIPSKPSEIARLVGKGCSSNLARVVAAMFDRHPTDATKLVHSRLEIEKAKQAAWKEKCRAGGQKSAELKKTHPRLVELPLEQPLQDSTNIPSPSPSPSPIINTHTRESSIPTIQEVEKIALIRGIPKESVKAFYDHHEGNQLWINQHGRLINWEHKLKTWAENDRSMPKKQSEPKPVSKMTHAEMIAESIR